MCATQSCLIINQAKDSQKIKKKTKFPRITDEQWNSQKQLSGPVEKKKEEKKRREQRKDSCIFIQSSLQVYFPYRLLQNGHSM